MKREQNKKKKNGGTNPKMAERGGGTLGTWGWGGGKVGGGVGQGWELNQLEVRVGRTRR